jgi:hypothetical protein
VFLTLTIVGASRGLDLRDSRDGHLVRSLLPARYPGISAALAPNGSVLAAEATGRCHVQLERIDPATGDRRALRQINEFVDHLAISPDGTRIAYVTYPTCMGPVAGSPTGSQPGGAAPAAAAGPAAYLPNEVVVTDLDGAHRVSTATDQPGHPVEAVAFSHDGTRLAVDYIGDPVGVRVFRVATLSLAAARRLDPPAGCRYIGLAWTTSGLTTAEACAPGQPFSPSRLVRLNLRGDVVAHWALPRCVGGVSLKTDATGQHVIAGMSIGYGNGPCGRAWSERISEVTRTALRPILDVPGIQQSLSPLGW